MHMVGRMMRANSHRPLSPLARNFGHHVGKKASVKITYQVHVKLATCVITRLHRVHEPGQRLGDEIVYLGIALYAIDSVKAWLRGINLSH